MVSTVEMFQGKEKPIIIVSTVRSGNMGVGFLNNQKVHIALSYENISRYNKLIFHSA